MFLIEVVEVEVSVLESEVAERACRLQSSLHIALQATGAVSDAIVDISLAWVFFL